jgi:hypothetical protein
MTQTEAATVLGINQPKVSALRCGKLTGFSIERLLRFLADLGNDVEIVVTPGRQPPREARSACWRSGSGGQQEAGRGLACLVVNTEPQNRPPFRSLRKAEEGRSPPISCRPGHRAPWVFWPGW